MNPELRQGGPDDQEVIVVGAGPAGLAAATALAGDGAKVTVLERRPYVGGRAYSYWHPALEETVDSQHVMVGCCTNLIQLCEQAGVGEKIRWYDRQTFLEPGGRASEIAVDPLPAPLHYSRSLLLAGMLGWRDKAAIARGLREFSRGRLASDEESAASWYRRTGQTAGAIRHFWEPILLATLNEGAANCSMKYAGKVFFELFLKNSTGGRLGIPTVPLSEFFGAMADRLQGLGATVKLRAGVEAICQEPDGGWIVRTADRQFRAKNILLALPFEQTGKLLEGMQLQGSSGAEAKAALMGKASRFAHSPFISVLLWFDRQITDLDHAWLLDTTIQWMFHKSRIRGYAAQRGSYLELVIAGSRRELPMTRAEILEPALRELERFFPAAAGAKLVKSGILKEARATFSIKPGLDAARPSQKTELPGLFLAGDWTRTEWPSTMEGAVRSGRLAAGAMCGDAARFLPPELPASGLMRWLA